MMWSSLQDDLKNEEIKWSSCVWRRGTVPIWWRSELKSQVLFYFLKNIK
jgi:hypothetical protein